MRHAGSLYLIVVGLLFMAAGGGFVGLMWRSFDRASDQRDWAEVSCVMIESRVEERKIGGPIEYRFKVTYGYQFEGTAQSSTDYTLRGSVWSSSRERAELLVENHPVGSLQTCYVHPEDPAVAVLKRDSRAPGYSIWFPMIFVVGGLGMIVGAVRSVVKGGKRTEDGARGDGVME